MNTKLSVHIFGISFSKSEQKKLVCWSKKSCKGKTQTELQRGEWELSWAGKGYFGWTGTECQDVRRERTDELNIKSDGSVTSPREQIAGSAVGLIGKAKENI